jgi:competence protein ComEC
VTLPALRALALFGLLVPRLAAAEPARMRVHFVDVGQGASTLVEFPCGAMLIDTGGEENSSFQGVPALMTYLEAFFARRTDLKRTIDVLWLTHPHIDHVRGAPSVLEKFSVRALVEDGRTAMQEDAVVAMARVTEHLRQHPEIARTVVRLSEFPAPDAPLLGPGLDPFLKCEGVDPKVTALWGGVDSDPGWGENNYGAAHFDNDNNHSAVVRIDFGESSLLVTGDLEEVAIHDLVRSRGPLLDVDIYQVGHHGSHNGTTVDLMRAMSPAWAAIAVGPSTRKHSWTAWAYGHPREKAVSMVEADVSGARAEVVRPVGVSVKSFVDKAISRAIYATGWDGHVVLDADATGKITVGRPDVALASPAPPDSAIIPPE